MLNEVSASRRSPTMDGSFSIENGFVTGEASEQQLPDLNSVPSPPGNSEMELLGWQQPAGLDLPTPAAADNYLPMVDMPPAPQPHQLMIPVWQLLPVLGFELPPPPPPGYQLVSVPEEEEFRVAAADIEEACEMRPNQFFDVQALEAMEDDRGKRSLLNEVPPPMFTLLDVHDETCILMKKVKLMSFAAWQDESGLMTMMPKATATGDGTFGKKIEGFMFQFGKEGEVGMMCFCHGNILTPAEFIMHAGGTPVLDPLTQIQVIVPIVESLMD